MSKAKTTAKGPRMSDEAVKAKTGKDWKSWFAILDKAGAKKMTHQEIATYLHNKQGVGPWWTQMVTVTYEQQRGMRELHQKPGGYEISVSRTLNTAIAKVYKAFANEKERASWLGEDGLVVRTSTANKSMRATWSDGKTSLSIRFYPKDANKTQVVVQQSKLADAKAAARMKTYWSKALDRLRESLEG